MVCVMYYLFQVQERMTQILTDPPPPPPLGSPPSSKIQQLRNATTIREEPVTDHLHQQLSSSELKMTSHEVFTGERKSVCELLSVC